MDKEFTEWWATRFPNGLFSAPCMEIVETSFKDVAYEAWKAGWDDGYDAPQQTWKFDGYK
jgi:hypothetical protein